MGHCQCYGASLRLEQTSDEPWVCIIEMPGVIGAILYIDPPIFKDGICRVTPESSGPNMQSRRKNCFTPKHVPGCTQASKTNFCL